MTQEKPPIRIEIRIDRGSFKRLGLFVGTFLLLAGAGVAFAVPVKFEPTTKLTAAQLNDNFDNLEKRTAALETARLAMTHNDTYSVAATYCGFTAPTTGKVVSGALKGYPATKALCVTACGKASAHMCIADELVRSAALGIATPVGGWMTTGLRVPDPGAVNQDCTSWVDDTASIGGPAWDISPRPTANYCNTQQPILCCN